MAGNGVSVAFQLVLAKHTPHFPGNLSRRVGEDGFRSHDTTDNRYQQRVMRAAQNEHVNHCLSQRVEVLMRDQKACRAVCPPFFGKRHEQRACLREYADRRVNPRQCALIRP
ncbi:MAG: hypothetical protein BWY06_02321 [Candidatus Latescibacteria bacterium ADurb.Bin168]|nr:MAG: hypothetical protein BWY06_02321 [Candidatus Latescibacteria bacterium ADurb.Bin168]